MYWACDVLVEHIFQEISVGKLFADVNQKHLKNLREKATKEVRDLKRCRQTGVQTFAATVSMESRASTAENVVLSPKSSARSGLTENTLISKLRKR